jgi:hypothetical protein
MSDPASAATLTGGISAWFVGGGTGNLSARQTFIQPAAAASPYRDERADSALLCEVGSSSLPGPRLEINLGLLSSQVPPSPSDLIELAECPTARQLPPSPSLRRDRPWAVYF